MLLLLDLLYLNTTRATMMFLNSFLLYISYCSHNPSSNIDPTCPSTGLKTSSLNHQHPWLLPALVVCVKPFPLLNLTTEAMWSACSSVVLKTFPTPHSTTGTHAMCLLWCSAENLSHSSLHHSSPGSRCTSSTYSSASRQTSCCCFLLSSSATFLFKINQPFVELSTCFCPFDCTAFNRWWPEVLCWCFENLGLVTPCPKLASSVLFL